METNLLLHALLDDGAYEVAWDLAEQTEVVLPLPLDLHYMVHHRTSITTCYGKTFSEVRSAYPSVGCYGSPVRLYRVTRSRNTQDTDSTFGWRL